MASMVDVTLKGVWVLYRFRNFPSDVCYDDALPGVI